MPYPGTPRVGEALAGEAPPRGLVALRHLSSCDALTLDALTPAQLAREVRLASARYYLRPSYVRSITTRFTLAELASLSRRAVSYLPSLALTSPALARLKGLVQ